MNTGNQAEKKRITGASRERKTVMPYEEDGTYTEDPEVDEVKPTENDQAAPPAEDTQPEGTEPPDEAASADSEGTNVEPKPDEDVLAYVKRLENQVNSMHRKLDKFSKAGSASKIKVPEKIDAANAPKVEDFDTIEEYEQASAAFSIDQRINDGIRKALERKPGEDNEQAREVFVTQIQEEGPKLYKDFNEVVGDPKLPITHEIIDATRETENENVSPSDILYYLGKNPDETAKLSRMSTIQVARAITKIEIALESAKQKEPPPTKKTVSSAPEPINPIDSTVIITKDPNKMTQREYEAWRAAGNG